MRSCHELPATFSSFKMGRDKYCSICSNKEGSSYLQQLRFRCMPGLVASLALAVSISPWMVRNALVFHRVIPMRDSMG
jgi:hypothetical protein